MPLYFILPALILLIGILYPFGVAVVYSLTDYRLIGREIHFIFLKNYIDNFTSSKFWSAMYITFLYTFFAVLLELTLGLGVAHLLAREFKGVNIVRTLAFLPLMIPPIIAGIMWKTMMAPDGVINYILSPFGINKIAWLSSYNTALPSVILIDIWLYLPFVALVLLSAIETLPQELFEAAKVDGATGFQRFRYITLPLLRPFITFIIIFRTMDSLKTFDIIYGTTRGGPMNTTRVIQLSIYEESLKWNNFGYALAQVMILWLIIYILSQYTIKKWYASSR